MADILVTSPYRPFTLPSQFKAVFNGYIYCGTVDSVDPSVSQVQVYLVNESGDKVPVAQPLRTNAGGFLVYNGQPVKFVTDSNHSLLVRDSLGVQLWYTRDMSSIDPESFMSELGSENGVNLVGNAADNRGEDFTGTVTAPGMKSLTTFGGMVVGDNPFAVPGSDFPGTAGLRDAVTISRKLVSTATDCHAVADKTVIEDASDAGTYGAFDVTTILRGNNPQSHLMAFQNRVDFAGSNVVGTHIGYLSWPTASGFATINNAKGAEIRNIETTSATIKNFTGVEIDPKGATDSNIGVLVKNATVSVTASPPISYNSLQGPLGYSLYASQGGKLYNKGKVSIGDFGSIPLDAATPYALNVREAGSTVTASLTASDANGAFLFANGDNKISFFTNASIAGYFGKAADSRAFIAGTNTQPLGTTTARWATANLITSPNVSSDERLKDFEDITASEIACAREVKSMMRKYRLKSGDGKIHFGAGAQSVAAVFDRYGLKADDYNIISVDENGFYSIVYEELLCFIALGS